MTNRESIFDKYNMSAGERRVVMFVLVVLIVVLAVMAFDMIPKPEQTKVKINKINRELKSWQKERDSVDSYKLEIKDLEGMSSAVVKEEQEVDMSRTINRLEALSGINVSRQSTVTTETNVFFLEKSMRIYFSGKESQIVDFLFKLGEGDSLVRVGEMRISPDKNRYKLEGQMELTASYQKNVTAPVVTVTPSVQTKVDSAKPTAESKKPDPKATEVEKPKSEQKPVAKTEPEPKPAKPNSTKRRIPTRRVRETQ
jgi:Tfp pilus assembly protein PilO